MSDHRHLTVSLRELQGSGNWCADIIIASNIPGAFHVTVLDNPYHPGREYTEALIRKYLHRVIADAALALQELE